jgi:acyl-CoA synthetase (AMP-forming)/AMP-acid ligase II
VRLIHALDHGATLAEDRPCIVAGEHRLGYPEVVATTWRVAGGLWALGLGRDDRVAIWGANAAETYLAWLGVLRSGCPLVPLNTRHAEAHNLAVTRRFGCSVLFVGVSVGLDLDTLQEMLPELRLVVVLDDDAADGTATDRPAAVRFTDWVVDQPDGDRDLAPDADAPVVVNLTSGTTGEPKTVVQTERTMEASLASTLDALRLEVPPVYLAAAPITHAAGTLGYAQLAQGGTVVLLQRAEPAAMLAAIEAEGVTTLFLPPTAIYALLASDDVERRDTSSLRLLLAAGAPLAPDKARRAIATFGPVIGQFYMMTEAPGMLAFLHPRDLVDKEGHLHEGRLASCGRPGPLGETAVVDDEGAFLPVGGRGEIVVRGSYVMDRYHDGPADSSPLRRRGWHRTGDIGSVDEDGFLTIVDRTRDVIVSGGFNVFPTEVERVLLGHPEVEDCAVVGAPDDHWGEAVTAVVQRVRSGTVDEETLRRWARERLGGVQAPKRVEFRDELPRSPVGKVLRREVRDGFWAGRDRQV